MEVKFKKGIPGFEGLNTFKIRCLEGNDRFKILESLDDAISFATINPFYIYDNYEIDLDDKTIEELQIESPKDVMLLTIITLGSNLESSTVNFKAPLVINVRNNLGKQFIIQSDKYDTRHPLVRRD